VAGFAAEGNRDLAIARGRFVGFDMAGLNRLLRTREG
jgi:hypothetical protein